MGVVALPSRVTGFRAISIIEEITFMPGCHASSNSSQRGLSSGEDWRRILKRTVLSDMFRQFERFVLFTNWTSLFRLCRWQCAAHYSEPIQRINNDKSAQNCRNQLMGVNAFTD